MPATILLDPTEKLTLGRLWCERGFGGTDTAAEFVAGENQTADVSATVASVLHFCQSMRFFIVRRIPIRPFARKRIRLLAVKANCGLRPAYLLTVLAVAWRALLLIAAGCCAPKHMK